MVGLQPTFRLDYPDNFAQLMGVFKFVDLDWDRFFYPQGELSAFGTTHAWLFCSWIELHTAGVRHHDDLDVLAPRQVASPEDTPAGC